MSATRVLLPLGVLAWGLHDRFGSSAMRCWVTSSPAPPGRESNASGVPPRGDPRPNTPRRVASAASRDVEGVGALHLARQVEGALEWARLMEGEDEEVAYDGSASPSLDHQPGFYPCVHPVCPCPASWNGRLGQHCCVTCRGGIPCADAYHQQPFEMAAPANLRNVAGGPVRALRNVAAGPVRNLVGTSRAHALRAPREALDEEVASRGIALLAQAPPAVAPSAQDQWDAQSLGGSLAGGLALSDESDDPDMPSLVCASASDSD